ncbi:MAG: hypothetical protein E7310_02585 [Clostridiales bacterium]|nr:hypothetical protein [Clostridiales bacterium]
MSEQIIYYLMAGVAGVFAIIVIAYFIIQKKLNKGDSRKIQAMREKNKGRSNVSDVRYQKLYIIYKSIPLLNRYLKKIRKRLEIINIEDEYLTRRQSARIITNALIITIPVILITILITKSNIPMMIVFLLFETFLVETIMAGMVDKIDTKLLKQQVEFFADIRHAYHEYNMVEEAIYEVSQKDELEISRQGEKIYEILISDEPEMELEKYYDVAPNSYLKEFAGISYLTREFGDRTVDDVSLYLKNLNNITEEMQLEILKREKLDYVFQSLSFISIAPVLFIEPLKNWAVSNFSFTAQFYNGKLGLIVQVLLIVLTFVCYILTRKLKDSGAIKDDYKDPNKVWQMKLYNNPMVKKVVDLFIPKQKTKEYRKINRLMKDSATKQKMETLYVNRIAIAIASFVGALVFCFALHKVSIDYVYNEPTADYNLLGQMSESDEKKAMQKTEIHNHFLKKLKGKKGVTVEQIQRIISESEHYLGSTEEQIEQDAQKIYDKLQIVNSEYLKWFEWLIAFVFAVVGYMGPYIMLLFQKILRKLEMENEVMQFQTIILMLMKIERVNVEMMLEWLERYANIFKEPITRCVNNYESGAWEALEELKNEITFTQLIQIVESLQAAVEKIPIQDAFDELDTEREYYQAKRKESNERLIARKGLIGKAIGFAPMVCLFVGYLIVPLVVIGMLSMTQSFNTMSTYM